MLVDHATDSIGPSAVLDSIENHVSNSDLAGLAFASCFVVYGLS